MDLLLLIAVAAVSAIPLIWLALRAGGHIGLALWLPSTLVLPYWAGAQWGGVSLSVVWLLFLTIMLIARNGLHLAGAPTAILTVLLLGVLTTSVLGLASVRSAAALVVYWGIAYVFGRLVGETAPEGSVSRILSWYGISLATLALVEWVWDLHPFVNSWSGSNSATVWSALQVRGGLTRSEWTMGHSIPLGLVLALLIPFVYRASRTVWSRLLATLLLMAGIAVTFSRAALLAGGLAILLSLFIEGRDRRGRATSATVLAIGVMGAVAYFGGSILEVFSDATAEIGAGDENRWGILGLVQHIPMFGQIDGIIELPDGRMGLDVAGVVYRSLDNAPILMAVQFGLIWGVVLVVVAVSLVRCALRQPWRPEGVAVVVSLVSMFLVAFLTYHAVLFWIVAGILASTVMRENERRAEYADEEVRIGLVANG